MVRYHQPSNQEPSEGTPCRQLRKAAEVDHQPLGGGGGGGGVVQCLPPLAAAAPRPPPPAAHPRFGGLHPGAFRECSKAYASMWL